MWLAAIAVVSALAGIGAGVSHTQPQNDASTGKGKADSSFATPGGAPAADVGDEKEHRQFFAHVQGPLGDVHNCPKADDIESTLTTTVSADKSLVLASSLHISANGVVPPHPSLNLGSALQRPEGARRFASCFIATDAEISSLTWADGKLEADFNLLSNDTGGYTNHLIKATLSADHSTLYINECAPHPEWAEGVRTICQIGTRNTVVVRVKRPIENLDSTPFPTGQETKDDYVDTRWQFQGPMPPLTVMLNMPMGVFARSWLYWNRDHNFGMPRIDSPASVNLYYIGDSSAIWLALAVAAVLLRGKRTPTDQLGASRRLLLIILASFLLGFVMHVLGRLNPPWSNGVVVVLTWGILAAAVASKRTLPIIAGLSVAALTPLCWVATRPTSDQVVKWVITAFCVALVLLVVTAAWVVWRQLVKLIALGNGSDQAPEWYESYQRVISGLVAAAFMFAVGFPIGEALISLDSKGIVADLAGNLVWSTGLFFRTPLAWVSLLLAVSYLAEYMTSRPRGCISQLQGPRRGALRSIRAGHRVVAAILALMICLSAPWTSRFALGVVIPVWVLQFVALWLGIGLLSRGARLHALRQQPTRVTTHLLYAATGTSSNVGSAIRGGEDTPQSAGASAAVATMTDRRAALRLLNLGSQPGQLANAKVAAQIASIIAIIPVAYLIWTTLAQFGGRLASNTGILIVALFAILEFARWVVSGFVFGYLYPKLPGRIGPVKALSFAAIWAVSCIGPSVIAEATGSHLTQETIYRAAQFALFAIVLAVALDLKTVKAAGGTWRDLRTVYDLQSYGELAAAVTPAALLALTLGQQIVAGSGVDVANTLLSGITSVLKGPG